MITGSRKPNLVATLNTGAHAIVVGLPTNLGGNDEGPNPHELLEAALAGCTILTVQMYANRKQWNLVSADVVVKIVSEGPEGTKISREVSLKGELTAEQRERLLEIADKCPVHKLLEGKVEIENKSM